MQLYIKIKLIFIRNTLLYLFDTVVLLFLSINKKSINKNEIVVIRLDAIGDFILWLDAAKNLRGVYDKNLVLVGNSQWIELAKHFNHWDTCIALDINRFSKNLLYRFKKLKEFKKLSSDKVLHPTYSRVFDSGDSVVRSISANEKIGYEGDCSNINPFLKKISDKWYTKLIQNVETDIHELQKNNTFVKEITGISYRCSLPKLSKSNTNKLCFQPAKYGYFIVSPGSSWAGKIWPEKNFSQIINFVVKNFALEAVLTGSRSEFELCKRIIDGSEVQCKNFAGQTSLLQLVDLIRGAKFIIGNDSSAVHIAAAVDTPSFCIVGGGHFNRFLPYPEVNGNTPEILTMKMHCFNCNWKCTESYDQRGPVPCIRGVDVQYVVTKLLNANLLKSS